MAALLLVPALAVAQSAAPATDAEIASRALLMAVEAGRTDLVEFALDNGADIESRDGRPDRSTALLLAVENGDHLVVGLLLARGADASEAMWTIPRVPPAEKWKTMS